MAMCFYSYMCFGNTLLVCMTSEPISRIIIIIVIRVIANIY